ncbi:MAG: sulfatase, partial [Thermomicrobiales bacterium]
ALLGPRPGQAAPAAEPAAQPDIIMILLDDMRPTDLPVMPHTLALLADAGMSFPNYFATTPLCGPSRASFFRGQYAHNHGVFSSESLVSAWASWHDTGLDQDTIAVWLQNAGYRTAHIGKHMNQFRQPEGGGPGWDVWVVPRRLKPFNYLLYVGDETEEHGADAADYLTDVLAHKATEFIASTPADVPLFLYLAPKAPHKPATPAPRHEGLLTDIPLDHGGSFNEADLSDKPINMQRPPLTEDEIAWLETLHTQRLQSLQAVDEAVAQLVATLAAAGRLENAYIFFSSDNGYALGEHRDEGKTTPYDEAVRVGLLARGPGIPAGRVNPALVANIDLAPTFAELAGAAVPAFVDGRSITPALRGGDSGRRALLLEVDTPIDQDLNDDDDAMVVVHTDANRIAGRIRSGWRSIRTLDWQFSAWGIPPVEDELYDLRRDPWQLDNLASAPQHAAKMTDLSLWLDSLLACAGDTCRRAENAPPP